MTKTNDQFTCKHCGFTGYGHIVYDVKPPAKARVDCQACGRYIKWLAGDDSHRRSAPHRKLVAKYGDYLRRKYGDLIPEEYGDVFCHLCLRNGDDLPPGRTIHAHHIIGHAEDGPADWDNVWILCDQCHALVEWVRRYTCNQPSSLPTPPPVSA